MKQECVSIFQVSVVCPLSKYVKLYSYVVMVIALVLVLVMGRETTSKEGAKHPTKARF